MTRDHAPESEHADAGETGADASTRRWLTPAALGTLVLVVLAHLLPRLVLGEDSIVTIHDNLDADFAYHVLIAVPGRMWNYHAQIPELLGGLPRAVYPSPTKLSSILFWLLPPFPAYVVLEAAVHAIAFLGMHALLQDHLPRLRAADLLLVSATYAMLPFYVIYDASVAAQPMVAWALLCLWKEQRVRAALAALFAFGFVSVLPTSGAFVAAASVLSSCIAMLAVRHFSRLTAIGLVALVAGCALSDLWFLRVMFDPPYVSHRSVWFAEGSRHALAFGAVLEDARHIFVHGHYHAPSAHAPILALAAITAGVQALRRRWREVRLLAAIVLVSYLLAFSRPLALWDGLQPLWTALPFTRTVHVRFNWFLPTLWYCALAYLVGLWTRPGARRDDRLPPRSAFVPLAVTAVLVADLVSVACATDEAKGALAVNYGALIARGRGSRTDAVSFREFCARDLFDDIDRFIGKPKSSYRVLSIGIHPSVAALNGFRTADGYHDNYPLAYKRRFRKLIAPELARDSRQRRYFGEWGSRVYVFLAHERASVRNERQTDRTLRPRRILIDPRALWNLKVQYVLSAYALINPSQNALEYRRTFTDPRAAWRVHLYRVMPTPAASGRPTG